MEDFTTLIWLGIAIIWFLTRLVRRGVRKDTQEPKKQPRPVVSRPAAPPTETQRARFGDQADFTGRDGKGPPPIVPR